MCLTVRWGAYGCYTGSRIRGSSAKTVGPIIEARAANTTLFVHPSEINAFPGDIKIMTGKCMRMTVLVLTP